MSALSGELEIDLSSISHNYEYINALSSDKCETACVIKADAYGLGVNSIAPTLYRAGARSFFVATIEEAIVLRVILPEIDIYILNGFASYTSFAYKQYNIIPTLNSLEEIEKYKEFASREEETLPAVLHFDTGMNRLGICRDEANILMGDQSILDGIDIKCIMSHLISSEQPQNPDNPRQLEEFKSITKKFTDKCFSLSNSGGVFLGEDYHFDMVRTGIALYGAAPVEGEKNPLRPVVSLKAPALQVKSVKKGESAGYNSTYTFEKDTHVVMVSAGYADGIFRTLGNSGAFYWNGYRLPIRGRVSMDMVICDLENVPAGEFPKSGDMVEIIGDNQSIDDIANDAGTIPYEILTSLGSRYDRNYV